MKIYTGFGISDEIDNANCENKPSLEKKEWVAVDDILKILQNAQDDENGEIDYNAIADLIDELRKGRI